MCLTGVDYFSTLAYQPSIAFEAAGLLAPLTTVVLVAVTLFGACRFTRMSPIAHRMGRDRSPSSSGSCHGWTGKTIVLALLGFAATDFVITKTLSAADAAVHLMDNPDLAKRSRVHSRSDRMQQRNWVTMTLLVILGATFIRGFKEAIGLAVVIVGGYLVLNVLVIGSGLVKLATHPQFLSDWYTNVAEGRWHLEHSPLTGTGGWTILAISLLLFPKLALGLSGFETGVAVMPLIIGDPTDTAEDPRGAHPQHA